MKTLWGTTGVLLVAVALAGCDNRPAQDQTVTDQSGVEGTAGTPGVVPSAGDMAPPTDPTATPNVVDVPTYVQTAASSDMFELRSSQLALEQSQDRQLRDFAQRMRRDHQASSGALKQAVGASGQTIAIPTEMMPRHAQMIRDLEQAAGGNDRAGFDRLYINQQRTAHAEALNLHRTMAQRGDLPAPLRTFAQQTADTVEQHYQTLMEMPGGAGSAGSGVAGAGTPAADASGTAMGGTATPM